MATTFDSYAEKGLRAEPTGVQGGRLQAKLDLVLVDQEVATSTAPVSIGYELFGPGDVERLGGATVIRRFPVPGTSDAEQTKLVHVEFQAVDLPWRYTPEAVAGGHLKPWLVLVVGERAAEQIVERPDGRVGIGPFTQSKHVLADSHLWAHVHHVDDHHVSRVVSPLDLAAQTQYVACLVPAFADDGSPAWSVATAGTVVVVDCYDRWTFRTGPAGDFPDLAAMLHKADLAAISAASGTPFGRADVEYSHRSDGTRSVLPTAGALRLPPTPDPDPADAPVDPPIAVEVTHLSDRIVTPDGRGVVTAPRYDAAFVSAATQAAYPQGGWVDQLRSDPRARGAAGLGAWNAIAWQDRIASAAATKVGELAVADDRIRHVALGVEASRSLWRRRVPPLTGGETSAAAVLDVLGPALGRLPTGSGTVLDYVAGRTPRLARALFSSAARRALRPTTARGARAADGAASLPAALIAANHCHETKDDPADVQPNDVAHDVLEGATKDALYGISPENGELVGQILERLLQNGRRPTAGELVDALAALAPGKDGRADPEAVQRFLLSQNHPDPDDLIGSWGSWVSEQAPREPCDPVDLVALATAVAGAIDPTVARPPAAVRVLATLPGINGIGPVDVEPELDLPLWSFLSTSAPDWMLPGAGDLTEGDVVALSTNAPFVQALLTGANTQTTGELRWRNLPLRTAWSPLRKFWQRDTGQLDINPVKAWPPTASLGDVALAAAGGAAEAVVAFKTTLFRRYPTTVVYLYETLAADFSPPPADAHLDTPRRVDHVFTGTIGAGITFFGFPIPPGDLRGYWVVLEEPPAGYRFYHASTVAEPIPTVEVPFPVSSAQRAYNRFAAPVRVLIGPLL